MKERLVSRQIVNLDPPFDAHVNFRWASASSRSMVNDPPKKILANAAERPFFPVIGASILRTINNRVTDPHADMHHLSVDFGVILF